MSTLNVEGFSLSHAAILDGTDGSEEVGGDLYGIRSGSLEVDMDTFDNTGDDAVLSQWIWFNYATVSVEMGYIPLEMVSLVTGEAITSSGVSPADYFDISLWTDSSLNQPTRPMKLTVPSKDSAGAIRLLTFLLYKCQFHPLGFDGPNYKDGLMMSYSATALISTTDEAGVDISSNRAIGRLVSGPVA